MTREYSEDILIEKTTIELFYNQLGWEINYAYDKEILGEDGSLGRLSYRDVVLKPRLLQKLKEFNPGLPEEAYNHAINKLTEESSMKSLAEINFEKYRLMRDGIPVEYTDDKGELIRDKKLRVFDFNTPTNNHFLAVRQLWVQGRSYRRRRPDIIGFVNGLPLLFIELKAACRELENAYNDNFTDYKDIIPHLFHYNAFVLISNGVKSRVGSITGKYQHFHEWKRITEEEEGIVALDRIIVGICEKNRFMDLFENFILFDDSLGDPIKIIARNHQYIGVNKAIDNIILKNQQYEEGKISFEEKQRLGVFWHTQGSGKSYSMVFFAQKIHRTFGGSYTFLVVTDRNELDNQIYGTFSSVGAVPKIKAGARKSDESIKAGSGKSLQKLLGEEHRYLFTLIHKFNFDKEITRRENIIVISDEAHRTQGGQLAMNMRHALPGASFIGFTGTPLFKDDEMTRRIFGDYISRYDFKRSVEDGATVPLYYENRGEYLALDNPQINEEIRQLLDESEDLESDQRTKIERLFAKDYPILTAEPRLNMIARDVVWHFCNRGYKGKAMYIAFDKLTAVKMYNHITRHWEIYIKELEKDIRRGKYGDQEQMEKERDLQWIKDTEICVVVSPEQNEVKKFTAHGLDIDTHREKMNTQNLEERFKEENDPFRLVIVCAMWITGFDVPTLSTLYLDKPMKSHTLMQAIARANRIHEGKENGLIVDYIETYTALLDALAIYGSGDTRRIIEEDIQQNESPIKPKEDLFEKLEEALIMTETFLLDEVQFDLNELINTEGLYKIAAMEKGIDAIYTNDETKRKYQVLAREIFRKYKALQPDKGLREYAPRRNAINTLYDAIQDKVESADVTELMLQIQQVVDRSVQTLVSESPEAYSTSYDLSSMDFEVLERYFLKTTHKKAAVQSLKDSIESQLRRMTQRNPLTIDYYRRYQEIIDDYNRGKDEAVITDTFRRLIELVNSFTHEEADTRREGLTDEQKAIFDILRQGKDLDTKDKNKVKEISIELLDTLKKDKLNVENWAGKSETSGAVFQMVTNILFEKLPFPIYQNDDIDRKTHMVYNHLENSYWGGGQSVYMGAG